MALIYITLVYIVIQNAKFVTEFKNGRLNNRPMTTDKPLFDVCIYIQISTYWFIINIAKYWLI